MAKTSAVNEAASVFIGIALLIGFFYTIYLAIRGRKFPITVMLTWVLSIVLFYSVPALGTLAAFIFVIDSITIWIYGCIASWKWFSGIVQSI